jgi:hypothetical protein
VDTTFRYSHPHYFFIICIRAAITVIICYPQIGNESFLNAFKNNFVQFLIFWACFENIMQHKRHVETDKKKRVRGDDGCGLKIFMIINAHKKHPYISLSMIQ